MALYGQLYFVLSGEVSESLLTERPALRERLGREWTREHYRNHRRHRDQQFLKEKVGIIKLIMAKRGHNALILAGEPRFVSRLRDSLPKHLQARIAGEIRTGVREDALPAVVDESIRSFLEQEDRDSHDAVRMLDRAVRRGGLAVMACCSPSMPSKQGKPTFWFWHRICPNPIGRNCYATRCVTKRGSRRFGGVGCWRRTAEWVALLRYHKPTAEARAVAVSTGRQGWSGSGIWSCAGADVWRFSCLVDR